MGGSQSVEGFDGEPFGYRILDVQPQSPGAAAGLVSWFDFVVEAAGRRLVRSSAPRGGLLRICWPSAAGYRVKIAFGLR